MSSTDCKPFTIQPFTWGRVVDEHSIGVTPATTGLGGTIRYTIVEYKPYQTGIAGRRVDEAKPNLFHVYVDERDTHMSCTSMEQALVYAVAWRSLGPNPEGVGFIWRGLKLEDK